MITPNAAAPTETSFPKSQIRVLLLENVHPSAEEIFRQEGFRLETRGRSPSSSTPAPRRAR